MKHLKKSLETYKSIFNTYRRGEQKLDDILLYVDFVENKYDIPVILLKDGGVLLIFEITGIDHEKLSDDEKEACSNILRTCFTQLDTGYVISNYLNRDNSNCNSLIENENAPEIIKYIQQKKQGFWDAISAKSYSNTIFGSIRYWNPAKREIPWTSLINEKKIHEFSKMEIEKNIDKLYEGLTTIKSTLSRFGFFIPNKDETFEILYRLINNDSPPSFRDDLSLNVQLAHSCYEFMSDTLKISQKIFSKVISVKYPPKYSHPIYLERLFDMDIKFIIRQTFRTINFQAIERRIRSNQNIARSLSSIDKSSENYVEEADEYMKDVKVNGEIPVRWSLSMTLFSENEEYLNEKVSEVITIFKELGTTAIVEHFNLSAAIFGSFPGMEKMNLRYSSILARNAGDFFSIHLLFRGDKEPTDYFLDRAKGIFSYTPFTKREDAYHMAITGPTGGGKSFLVNKLLLSGMIYDPRIYVIDLSRSFTELFDFLKEESKEDTSVLTVSKDNINFSFNPFLIQDLDKDISDRQLRFCEGLLRIMIGPNLINGGNRIIISETLTQFFLQYRSILKSMGEKADISPLDILIPILEQNSKNRDIPNALRYWQTGQRGKLFNSGKDTIKSAKYVYFDIRDLESSSEEISAIIYSIFNKIYSDISDPARLNVPKFLFLDEAHRYLKNSEFSFWIDLLIRMGRHYNLLVGIITQSINDLVTDENWSTGIVNNIKQGFFFSGQRDIESAFKKLQMNESHINLYNNMKSSEREVLYWSSKGIRRVLSPLTDPFTYWIATTDPEERLIRSRMKEEICEGDTDKTIDKLVSLVKNFEGNRVERISFIESFLNNKTENGT